MTGLNQIRDAVVAALRSAGMNALAAHAGKTAEITGPVLTVDVGEVAQQQAALCSYLGEQTDANSGEPREVYGRRLDVTIALEARAPAAADCESACESAAEVLLGDGLPSGLRMGVQSWEAVTWDKTNRLFLRRGSVKCRALFLALADAESADLLEFTLKGVLTS